MGIEDAHNGAEQLMNPFTIRTKEYLKFCADIDILLIYADRIGCSELVNERNQEFQNLKSQFNELEAAPDNISEIFINKSEVILGSLDFIKFSLLKIIKINDFNFCEEKISHQAIMIAIREKVQIAENDIPESILQKIYQNFRIAFELFRQLTVYDVQLDHPREKYQELRMQWLSVLSSDNSIETSNNINHIINSLNAALYDLLQKAEQLKKGTKDAVKTILRLNKPSGKDPLDIEEPPARDKLEFLLETITFGQQV